MSEPRIAQEPASPNLLVSSQLERAYKRANDPKYRESAVVPLFQKFFTTWMCSDHDLGVYSQQQLDGSGQQVDLTVGYYNEDPMPDQVFVLLAECRRNKGVSFSELETHLEEYANRYLDKRFGGLAKDSIVYGATALGTKIRFFTLSRKTGHINMNPHSGEGRATGDSSYWDVKTDGILIHAAMKEIWDFYKSLSLTGTT